MAKTNKAPAEAAETPAVPTVVLQSLRHPFSAQGDTVRARSAVILRHVGGVTVLNTTTRAGLTPAETEVFDDVMVELRMLERPVHRVASFGEFFDGARQFNNMTQASEADSRKLAESVGLELTDQDYQTMVNFHAVKAKVLEFFKGRGPQYVFVKRPSTNAVKLAVTETQVSNGNYEMTRKQAAKVWERARAVWESGARAGTTGQVSALRGYSGQRFSVTEDTVSIGCQVLSRWQVEQAALEMGLVE